MVVLWLTLASVWGCWEELLRILLFGSKGFTWGDRSLLLSVNLNGVGLHRSR